jgi:hypothetical protein
MINLKGENVNNSAKIDLENRQTVAEPGKTAGLINFSAGFEE